MRALALAVALCASFHGAQAAGQRRLPSDARVEEARDRFYAGAQLYEEGDYEAALAEFVASQRLNAAPVATFNIAQTLRALHRYEEAMAAYRRYLREGGESLPAARRAQVEGTIRALSRRIASITFEVEPAGAEVRVDGRSVGRAPLAAPLVLAVGRRVLEITAEGHVPMREELEVVGGRPRTVRVRLARHETAGTVRLTSQPERARVRIDGLDVGAAPLERRLPHGGHLIEAELPGHATYRASIELAPRQRLDLNLVLSGAREWYEEWWFWTGASAVVVAAIVVIAVLAQPGPPQPIAGNSYDGIIAVLRAP
ncbi:MAG: PEGA domain-containing protein [Sandaracinaceae bacterium]|nr:PEGA domain-containing protein [Sandaracinaceae bacterium]